MTNMFKDDNGKISFSRVIGLILTLTYIGSELFILITEHKIIDIPVQLAGLIALLYGTNKISHQIMKGGNKNESSKNESFID